MLLDGGADNLTREIVHNIHHPRLRIIELSTNGGPYATRTVAIEAAQTDWYAHLDGDDRLPPEAIGLILRAIEQNPHAQYVRGDCLHFNETASWVVKSSESWAEDLAETLTLTGTSPIHVDLFRQLGGFAPELVRGGADWDFWIGVAELGVQESRAKGTIYERRHRPGSVGDGWKSRYNQVARIVIDRHPAYFSVNQRKQRCLGRAYELMARVHRSLGNRDEAAQCAKLAIDYGQVTTTLDVILLEMQMPWWRYRLRRFARYLSTFSFGNQFSRWVKTG
jgi:glycosyltransferase involved in cell wall biosynthesis